MGGKVTHNRPTNKKKEESKNLMMIYDRPFSAKGAEERRKTAKYGASHNNVIAEKLGGQELMVTNSSKKRYPSNNIREDPYKWK